MKKIMIGVLILIPILILVIVQAVSVVVSTRTHIGVESVTFDSQSFDLALGEEIYDFHDYLTVEVLPERASDKTYTWAITDLQCMDEDYAARREYYLEHADDEYYDGEIVPAAATLVDGNGNDVESNSSGLFKLNSYCSFYVEAKAETSKARCLVYVGGFAVEKVSVKGESTVRVGESVLMSAICTPVDSIVENTVWSSGDERIAVVDENGGVRGISVGTTTIKASVLSPGMEYVESAEYEITVQASVSAFGPSVDISTNTVGLSALGISADDITAWENCTIEGDTLILYDENVAATVTTALGTLTINICDDGNISIQNSGLYAYDEDKSDNYVLAVGEQALSLNTIFKNAFNGSKPQNVRWNTNRPSVAIVDGEGRVTGVSRGIVTVTASVGEGEDIETASITLLVETKIASLLLENTDSSFEVGIAKETVFASKKFADDTNSSLIANGLTVNIMRPVPPIEASDLQAYYAAFIFEVLEKINGEEVVSDKAVFDGNVLTFVPENIEGRVELIVRVHAKYPKYSIHPEYTTRSFKLNVVDGIEIDSYASLVAAAAKNEVICFDDNVQMMDGDATRFTYVYQGSVKVSNSIYGNNYRYSAAYNQMYDYSGMFEVINDNVTISNIQIRCNEVTDEITDAKGAQGLSGKCIGMGCHTYSSNRILDNLRLEFSILENGSGSINLWGANLDVEGCIFRNTSGSAFFVQTERNGDRVTYSNLKVKNCVMSNMIGTGFSFPYSNYSSLSDPDSIERAKNDVAEGRNSTFTQEGFLDIYNWQSVDILNLLDIDGLAQNLKDAINAFARNEINSNPAFVPFFAMYNGVKYFHMGFLTSGFMEPSYLEPQLEDKRFGKITTEVLSIELVRSAPPISFYAYMGNETEIPPGKTYSINDKLISKLHGYY